MSWIATSVGRFSGDHYWPDLGDHRGLGTGMKPAMVRLTVARKIAAIVLTIWKKGGRFDPEQLKRQAA
jgi:hypothetical protein